MEDGDIITTKEPDAEKFSMTSLLRKSDTLDEEVSVYGISDNSQYVKIDDLNHLKENEAYISASYADKYDVDVGDEITLDEKYENQQYTFRVAGIFDKSQSIAVFLPIENYREVFEQDADAFGGYFSDTEITDIAEENIATVITEPGHHENVRSAGSLDGIVYELFPDLMHPAVCGVNLSSHKDHH